MINILWRHVRFVPLFYLGLTFTSSRGLAQRRLVVEPSRVDSIVEAHRSRHHVPSVGLFIGTTGGRRLYEKSYGAAQVSPWIPATSNTLYLLASVSKPYAAVVAHRLAELHRLDLAAPISRYLQRLPSWSDSVSVRQLLAHSSGLLDYTDVSGWNETATADDYIARTLAAPLRFPPGTRTEYSNTNYALVQRIIEVASGESYIAATNKLVLGPLGLSHTHFDCPATWNSALAQGYRWVRGDSLLAIPFPGRGHPDAVGGLCASAADVGQFVSSILSGRLLSNASVRDLHTIERGSPDETAFGAGFAVARETTGEVWSHSGALRGGNTEVAIWPTDSLLIVVLSNLGAAEVEHLSREIARSVLDLTPPLVLDLPLQPGLSARYAGRYKTANGRFLVAEQDGHLVALGQQRCYNQGDDIFICDPDQSRTVRFVGDSSGIREAWVIIEGVRQLRGLRVQP
jgi:D-alanyl-D-alanine carboxypeptidase